MHLSDNELERYRERQMSPEELLSSGDHLSQCGQCTARLIEDDRAGARVARLSAAASDALMIDSDHPSFEQISDYVDARLRRDERDSIELHLASCAPCKHDVDDLSSFRPLVEANSTETYAPKNPRLKTRLALPNLYSSYRIPINLAVAITLILVVVWLITLPLRSEISSLRAELSHLREINNDLSNQASAARELESKLADLSRENDELRGRTSGDRPVEIQDAAGKITIDMGGNLSGVGSLDMSYRQEIKTALLRERVEVAPDAATLQGKSGALMGPHQSNEGYGLVSPVGENVEATRPTFRWRPVSGATLYVVSVYAPGFALVSTSGPVTATEWTTQIALQRGRVYSWQVRTTVDDKEVVVPAPQLPDARFRILDNARLAELRRIRQTSGQSHLVLGIAYARLGLLEDSEHELRTLLNSNPQSRVVQNLLRSVSSRRNSVRTVSR